MLIEDVTTDEHRRGAEVAQSPQAGQWGREERGEDSRSSSTVEGEQQAATAAAPWQQQQSWQPAPEQRGEPAR